MVDAGWYPRYRDGGFGPRNLGEVILALEQPVPFELPGDYAKLRLTSRLGLVTALDTGL